MIKLTREQAIVITAYTGVMAVSNFDIFVRDLQERTGKTFFTHDFASEELWNDIKEVYKDDFVAMCYTESINGN